MPLGPVTIRAEQGAVGDALRSTLNLAEAPTGRADVQVCAGVPQDAGHVIITGDLDDAIDAWDAAVAPQTVAGALWLSPSQPRPAEAAVAWLALRLLTPTTPLSDLTDNNGRALRWSVADAIRVDFPVPADAQVDPDQIKAWADAQPAVVELGQAVARIGGDTAQAVLNSMQRFRSALAGLVGLGAIIAPQSDLDEAVAEHLRQVQRTGFARWRGAKARAVSQEALQSAARGVAAEMLGQVLAAREHEVLEQSRAHVDEQAVAQIRAQVARALDELALPATPDFAKVPRSWTGSVPAPRRYVFVNEAHLELAQGVDAPVRPAAVPEGYALCAIVQSGFSLPALR